jgi:penicillin-binding protein 1C
MLLAGEGGQRARCTLDGELQAFVLEALNRQLAQLAERNVRDGAVLVVDNGTGEILAYAANQGGASSAPHVDGIRALRQAGSTLKPFLYGLAIEKRFLTAASILEDAPLQIPTAGGLYVPENYDREFLGPVSLRTALSASLNIPAVRKLMLVTPMLSWSGMRAPRDGKPRPRGGLLRILARAGLGRGDPLRAGERLPDARKRGALGQAQDRRGRGGGKDRARHGRAGPQGSSRASSRTARPAARPSAWKNPLATRFWTAVKTGTSKDMRDNWCVGYSERYTVGVWVGNFRASPCGTSPAWPAPPRCGSTS